MVNVIISISAIICVAMMAVVVALVDDDNRSLAIASVIISVLSGLLSIGLLNGQLSESDPKAIDVYRGNTELKVVDTIESGKLIKSDTIVVFKNNHNK